MTDRGRKIATWVTLWASIAILTALVALLFHAPGREGGGGTGILPVKHRSQPAASAGPAVMSRAEIAAIKLPRGIHLAQLPWAPVGKLPGAFHLAQLPWVSNGKLPPGVHLAQVPWVRGHDAAGTRTLSINANVFNYFEATMAQVTWSPFRVFKAPVPARFVTALCRDRQGNIWIATEDHGVFRYDPAAPEGQEITQFTKRNTDGQLANNDIYALACDNHGRIWAGLLNKGVAVYDGQRWQDYDVVQNPEEHARAGPLGGRAFALKFDRYTGQMWVCTNAGISIYQCSQNDSPGSRPLTPVATPVRRKPSPVGLAPGTWHYITQSDGLPQNPDCVAFAPNGTVYVGTQCSGIAYSTINDQRTPSHDGADGYDCIAYHWHTISGPWKMPLTTTGKGLPGNLINCVAIEPAGTVIVGTDSGIAFGMPASPAGRSAAGWSFLRGQDLPAKVAGLWKPPQHWQMPSNEVFESLPKEDYTTAVAISGDRLQGTGYSDAESVFLWIGHRQRGIDVWQYSKTGKITNRWQIHEPQIGNYVTSLLPLPGGAMAVGAYGQGVSIITLPDASNAWKAIPHDIAGRTKLHIAGGKAGGNSIHSELQIGVHEPKSATPPPQEQLTELARRLTAAFKTASPEPPAIVPITDDWKTQGAWLGRYGRCWACLFACCASPPDFVWSPASIALNHYEEIGPHHRKNDSIRYWVQWLATAKKRVLELPEIYLDSRVLMHLTTWNVDRRESEIDDHGAAYPWRTWQGPDLYVYLHIPPGAYTLSLYFFNKDGHFGNSPTRDYVLSVIPLPDTWRGDAPVTSSMIATLAGMGGVAHSRVVQFWGGAWKRFIVRGPLKLAVRVDRNYSLDAILPGAMLDPLTEHPAPYYCGRKAWHAHEKQRSELRTKLVAGWQRGQFSADSLADVGDGGLAAALRILRVMNVLEHRNPAAWAANERLAYLSVLRWCVAGYGAIPKRSAISAVAEKCYYHLGLFHCWEAVEKSRGILTSRQIEKGLRWDRRRDSYRGLEFNTIRKYVKGLKAARKPIAAN